MQGSSLYRYLLTRILCFVVPIVLAGMAVQWHFERGLLEAQFDEALVEKASILATLVTQDGDELELEFADEFMAQYSRAEDPYFFQVWYPDGRSLERSYSLAGEDLPFRHGPLEEPAVFTATLASGIDVRCVGIEFPPRLGSTPPAHESSVVIVVGADGEELDTTLARGYAHVALTGLVSAAGISIFVLVALRRGVHLLRRAVGEVERITPGVLEHPLDEGRVPEEIRPIVAALNRSMQTIRGFVERERRFTADVAHELRTPIAELRAAADVAARWPDDESRSRLTDDARAIALQMEALVESLLELAVLEGEGAQGEVEAFDLVELVGRVAEQVERPHGAGKELALHLPPTLRIASHAQLWEVIVRNLVDNAFAHSPPGAVVRVGLHADGDGARLSVSNPIDSLDPELAERCRERLWRAKRDLGDGQHFGLGLSIVEAACARLTHRLTVRVQGRTFHATISRTAEREGGERVPVPPAPKDRP